MKGRRRRLVKPATAFGSMRVTGNSFAPANPREAIHAGLALAPEDRKQHGLILQMAVRENASLASLGRDQQNGLLNFKAEEKVATEAVEQLAIKTPNLDQLAKNGLRFTEFYNTARCWPTRATLTSTATPRTRAPARTPVSKTSPAPASKTTRKVGQKNGGSSSRPSSSSTPTRNVGRKSR